MREIIYDKLIRDNILDIIEKNEKGYEFHIADQSEYEKALLEKVNEELDEFIEEPCEEEMADILEVLDAVMNLYNLDEEKIKKIKKEKADKKGKFQKRIILEKVIESS